MAHAPDVLTANGTSMLSSDLGEANVLTSSFTPALSSPESAFSSAQSLSPTASKHSTLLEKRANLMNGLISKAKERTMKGMEQDRSLADKDPSHSDEDLSPSDKDPSQLAATNEGGIGEALAPSVSFAGLGDLDNGENSQDESQGTEDGFSLTVAGTKLGSDRKEGGLVRRPSGIMLSSRIRDSTNLDAPRYSIREMEVSAR